MKWRYALSLVGALLVAQRGWAADSTANAVTSVRRSYAPLAAARRQAAPGGGDMLVVGPELHHVTRGRVDADGHLSTDCRRDGAAPPRADGSQR